MSIGKQTFAVRCDTFGCMNQANHTIGNHSAKHTCTNLCDECFDKLKKDIIKDLNLDPNFEVIVDIFYNALMPDGKLVKSELIQIAQKYGVEATEKDTNYEILKKLVGEKS